MTAQVSVSGRRGKIDGEHTVDATHLLSNHDRRSSIVGSADTRNGEAVSEPGEVVGVWAQSSLLLVDDVGVVKVAGGNDGMSTQSLHAAESLGMLSMFHEPAR